MIMKYSNPLFVIFAFCRMILAQPPIHGYVTHPTYPITTADTPNGREPTVTDVPHRSPSDGCDCLTEWPAVFTCSEYVPPDHTDNLWKAKQEISKLRHRLDEYNETVTVLLVHVTSIKEELNVTQTTLQSVLDGTVIITVGELEILRGDLEEMSQTLRRVEESSSDVHEVTVIREELNNLTRFMTDLAVMPSPGEAAALRVQIEELKTRLAECEDNSGALNDANDDNLFQPWNDSPLQDSCSGLLHVSDPYTLRGRGSSGGAWFRDPLLNYSMVWYAPFHNSRYTYQIDRFANVADFRRGTNYESRYILPTGIPTQGPGMVAYNGSLYYHAHDTRDIVRYDTTTRSVAGRVTIDDAVINNEASYTAFSYTDIDLAVDEAGLWVIYVQSSVQSATALRLLNPETLDVVRSWSVPSPKTHTGNCFMVCAKLYCINNHFSHEARIKFEFDTVSGVFRTLDIGFDVHYNALSSLDYNPRDQKLYGWDRGHQVLYDLTFDLQESRTTRGPDLNEHTTFDTQESHPTYPYWINYYNYQAQH